MNVSVVMFAYNEEENVAPVMEEVIAWLAAQGLPRWELVLVSDGSSDGTADAARAVRDRHPNHVQVVDYKPNRGIGGALKAGWEVARYEWLCGLPADGQIAPEELGVLFRAVRDDPRVRVVTAFFPERFEGADNFTRKVLSRGLRALMWVLTGVSRKLDGMHLIHREEVARLKPKSESFFLNLELPIRALAAGVPDAEVALKVRPRRAGESKVLNRRRIQAVVVDLAKLGWELRFGGP